MSNNAIIYSRISSPAQCSINNFHISIENQLTNSRIYCENNGMNIVEEIHEIKSARNMKYLHKLNEIIKNNSNINLIIYNITRFSRNILQGLQYMEKLRQQNITIHFVEENAKTNHHLDLHRIRLGLSQSEYESDTISNRVNANNMILKNKGWSFGVPKYGKETVFKNSIRCFQSSNLENKIIQFIITIRQGKCTVMALNKLLQDLIPNNTNLIEFYDNETNSLITRFDEPYTLSFTVIADLLNSYNIMNRNNKWSASSVNRVYNNNHINIHNKFSSMNI
jgi:DNA invertase Pin-like site-specific DNA recombinase